MSAIANCVIVKIKPNDPAIFESNFKKEKQRIIESLSMIRCLGLSLYKNAKLDEWFLVYEFQTEELAVLAHKRELCLKRTSSIGDVSVNEQYPIHAQLPDETKEIT